MTLFYCFENLGSVSCVLVSISLYLHRWFYLQHTIYDAYSMRMHFQFQPTAFDFVVMNCIVKLLDFAMAGCLLHGWHTYWPFDNVIIIVGIRMMSSIYLLPVRKKKYWNGESKRFQTNLLIVKMS